MNPAQQSKYAVAIAPATIVDDSTATATAVDCKGAAYAEVILQLGATDIAVTALKLQECDTVGGTYVDITNASFDGKDNTDGTALELPSATDDNQTCVFQVNMLGRKRFLKVVATFGDGTAGGYIAGVARLSKLAYVPDVDTDLANGGVCRV